MEPPTKKQCLGKETEKQDEEDEEQTGWFNLPFELRNIIMEQMGHEDIPKFARCSKLCYEEATSSNNYCDDIGVHEFRGDWKRFEIQFTSRDRKIGSVCLEDAHDGTTKIQCEKYLDFESRTTFFEKGDVYNVFVEYLDKYLQLFRRNLKSLFIDLFFKAKNLVTRKIFLRGFKKLKSLRVDQTPRQLCLFKYKFVDLEQVLYAKSLLRIRGTRFTFDQLVQLKSEWVEISLMDLTKKDINQFLKYWRDGKLYKEFRSFWIYNDSKKTPTIEMDFEGIEYETVTELFGTKYIKINLKTEPNKYIRLSIEDEFLHMFIVKSWIPSGPLATPIFFI